MYQPISNMLRRIIPKPRPNCHIVGIRGDYAFYIPLSKTDALRRREADLRKRIDRAKQLNDSVAIEAYNMLLSRIHFNQVAAKWVNEIANSEHHRMETPKL